MNFLHERYRLLKLIGRGGFCKTYLGVDEGEFPPVPCVVQQLSNDNQTPAAFVQKAQLLEELGQHPQIPALLAHFQDDQYFYLVQEFIAGANLTTLLAEEGTFSETQIWQLLENILPVIKLISDRHLIHRDIKPENIIRTSPGNLVLVDFGAAIITSAINQLTVENSVGSPEYIAPEQAQGKPVFASDLYSLGVTCIHLLTQIPPFDLFDIANDCWVWQQYLTTRVSNRLTQILNKLLQNPLTQRFQTADEVMQTMGIANTYSYPAITVESISGAKFPIHPQWQCIHTISRFSGISASINALAISPDGNTLASGDDDKIMRLWDLNSKKLLTSPRGHTQAVKSVAFSPDGQTLATGSDDQTIKLWNLNTFLEIFTLLGHTNAVKSVAFSPDGQILASGSWDKTVKLWDVNTSQEICTLTGHQLQVSSVAFSPQGELLASASFDRTIRLWQLPARELKNRLDCTLLGTFSGHTRTVLTIAFSPDGKILASGSDDNTIKLWEVNTGQIITTLSGHSWSVVALAFTADGETLISASWDQTVKLWRVSTAQEIATLWGHVDSVSAIAVSQVGQLIASGSRDKTIKLWQP
ncbi:MAG: protein kinase [Gloeotrichia echinulata GP01]